MKSTLRSEWQNLRRGPAGQRFQRRYEVSRRSRNKITIAGRISRLVLAVVFMVIGVVLVFIPGPAIFFFVLAASLLATESLMLAKALDRVEVWLLQSWSAGKRTWHHLSFLEKLLVGGVAGLCAFTGSYLSWRILLGSG